MTLMLLAREDQLTEIQAAVRDQFQEGGSVTAVLIVLLFLIAVITLAYVWTNRRQHREEAVGRADPQTLFAALLQSLPLSQEHRRPLEVLAQRVGLAHPTAILLSPALFDQAVDQFHSVDDPLSSNSDQVEITRALASARTILFPQPRGFSPRGAP